MVHWHGTDRPLVRSDRSGAGGNAVTFEPGARTTWHIHPLGQVLIVAAGCGLVQREDGSVEEIHPGDVILVRVR